MSSAQWAGMLLAREDFAGMDPALRAEALLGAAHCAITKLEV